MRFRPLLWPTVFAVPVFAVLVALGVWQLERRAWKLDLIATMQTRLAAPEVPVAALEVEAGKGRDVGYRPTVAEGAFDYAQTLFWVGPGPHGEPGYHVLTPLIPASGPPVIVDRGFVPVERKDEVSRPQGTVTVRGIARMSQPGGLFTPPAEAKEHLVFTRDVPRMAQLMALGAPAPFFIEARPGAGEPTFPPVYPLAGQTQIQLRNEHLQYALTWFGLAATLLIVYLLYHRSRGRLG